jgi:hypothetical protein
MRETKCETVRHELEELMLDDECSMYVTQHMRECGDCREFHQKQTKLRQIVGSLGTVEAPPDFDFRLRARLANESNGEGFHARVLQWSFASKGFAAATMVLLFAGGVVYVRTIMNQSAEKIAEHRIAPPQQPPKPVENETRFDNAPSVVTSNLNYVSRPVTNDRRRSLNRKPALATFEPASSRPPSFSEEHRHSTIFSIDASSSHEPFKISLDDGRGNARTISVPTITFGSNRFLQNAKQTAQKGAIIW